ncbi:MAG: hypothetical protein IIC67_01465 [Thaumarchaeota archaeon]|nr:hypothetical protein [Nitrososphaerota archaeon]
MFEGILHPFERRRHTGTLSDIYDGTRWKDYTKNDGPLSERFSTAWMLNTDGVSVFKSGRWSIWPVYLMNLSLPPDMRKDLK